MRYEIKACVTSMIYSLLWAVGILVRPDFTSAVDYIRKKDDTGGYGDDAFVKETKEKHFPLFSVSEIIIPIGPTIFPKPTYLFQDNVNNGNANNDTSDPEIVTYIKPISGQHRQDQDAVFVFAAEYTFETYLLFLMTLYETGYKGDVVVGVSTMDWKDKQIRDFLEYWKNDDDNDEAPSSNDKMTVIVYIVKYHCYNLEGEEKESHKGGMRVCQCHNLFAHRNNADDQQQQQQQEHQLKQNPLLDLRHGRNNTDDQQQQQEQKHQLKPLLDIRHGRTAQTIRYELYWIWSEYYSSNSWILLIDARDTIFQQEPFRRVPRKSTTIINDVDNDDDDGGGTLIFFGENADATSLGKSKHNRKWLQLAYGDDVANAFQNKPTICSGSTMGEQNAIEMYLRAMVGESDASKTVIFGADQGFHNYLYYSSKLKNTKMIRRILVQDQGLGIINNLGALRDKDLSQWGNGRILQNRPISAKGDNDDDTKKNVILNWDGTISPIVHQYDRHKVLSGWWHRVKFKQFKDKWKNMRETKML